MIVKQKEIVQEGYSRNSHSMGVSLSQTLFDGGKWWNRIKQANANYRASEYTYRATRQTVISMATQRYYELLKALKLQEVYEKAVELSREQLKKTESMYEVGSVAQVDVYRARVNVGNSETNLIQQRMQVALAKANLNLALGRDPGAPIEIREEEIALEPFEGSLEEAIQIALANNPELHSLQESVKAARYGLKVARGGYFPQISASVGYSRYNTLFDRVYGMFDKNYGINFGIQVSWNLFDGFQTQASIERASSEYQIARENLLDKERRLRYQVEQAFLSLQAYKKITEINQESLQAAEEDLRLAQERYRVGAGTLLEVIDAQVNLIRARTSLVQTKYDFYIALANLYSAMGVLESKLKRFLSE